MKKILNRETHEPWQKHNFHCQRAHEKDQQREMYPSILYQQKLQEEFKIITQYKYHHWILRTISRWILTIRGWWIAVQKLRKKEENFDNMYFESSKHSVGYHEYGSQDSNNVEYEGQTFQHASGNRSLLKAGKSRLPGKQQQRAARQQQQQIHHRLHPRKKVH